jgi:hypothetical protein
MPKSPKPATWPGKVMPTQFFGQGSTMREQAERMTKKKPPKAKASKGSGEEA